jgi:hypothetical protein
LGALSLKQGIPTPIFPKLDCAQWLKPLLTVYSGKIEMKTILSLCVAAALGVSGASAMAQNYKKDADNHARNQSRASESTRRSDNSRIDSNTNNRRYEATRDSNRRK